MFPGAEGHESGKAGQNQPGVATARYSSSAPLGAHYLMLVNTAIAATMTSQNLVEFDKSPYDGIAIGFLYNYDTSPVPSAANMTAQIETWKRSTKKDIWPWVYINRMIAADDTQDNNHYYKNNPYFHRFRGADLDGQGGARADFLANWRNSLQAAKATGQPGVVIDLEYYNYYKEYDIGELARQLGKTPDQTEALLRQLGAEMADIAAEKFPKAVIWYLATGFTWVAHRVYNSQPYFPSTTYVAMGMLDEIRDRPFDLKVLSGGESALGYWHDSLQEFQDTIDKRTFKFAPQIQKYAGILELGGTMNLWDNAAHRVGQNNTKSVEDLQPYLELLLRSFRYDWIWASGGLGYAAFDPASAGRFNALIRKAQEHVYGAPATQTN